MGVRCGDHDQPGGNIGTCLNETPGFLHETTASLVLTPTGSWREWQCTPAICRSFRIADGLGEDDLFRRGRSHLLGQGVSIADLNRACAHRPTPENSGGVTA